VITSYTVPAVPAAERYASKISADLEIDDIVSGGYNIGVTVNAERTELIDDALDAGFLWQISGGKEMDIEIR